MIRVGMIYPEIGSSGGSPFVGGGVNSVVRLSRALRDRGHSVTVITTRHRYPGEGDSPEGLEGIKVISVPAPHRYLSLGFIARFYLGALGETVKHRQEFDIIHGHSSSFAPALVTGVMGRLSGKPSVHTLYSEVSTSGGYSKGFGIANTRILLKMRMSLPDKILAASRGIRNQLVGSGIAEQKVRLVLPMIDPAFNTSVSGDIARKEFGIQAENVLLYMGSVTRLKGLPALVEALRVLRENRTDWHVIVVLNVPMAKLENPEEEADFVPDLWREIKHKIEDYKLSSHVSFVGITEKLPYIMAAADFFIAPYLNTVSIIDYPLSILEAMASGKPVIASKVGGIPEIIKTGENGVLIAPGDVDELARAISHLMEHKQEVAQMGRNNARKIKAEFDPGKIAEAVEKVYLEVIKK